VRTKTATAELAEKLEARGYSASALNGDMNQQLRERTITRLKKKQLDIVVATDVAARGIDVERVSHVLNFDIPYDSEAYVHRIGRTGRAGRDGKAILFVAPREKRLLYSIEKNTRQKIEPMELPSGKEVSTKRIEQFKNLLTETLDSGTNFDFFFDILSTYSEENDRSAEDIACALAYLHQLERPLEVKDSPKRKKDQGFTVDENRKSRTGENDMMMRYRVEVGRDQHVGPGDIVGAIMNETDIHKNDIGHIKLHDDHSTVDLPLGLPKEFLDKLKGLTVRNLPINISEVGPAKRENRKPGGKGKPKGKPRGDRPGNHKPRKRPKKSD
jgi:ATP-dependent RNA helicase DeaD